MEFRQATQADMPLIVEMLADDVLGSTREGQDDGAADAYARAFAEILADPNNELVVACKEGEVVGTFQLTFIPNMSFQGGKRAQIEAVRVKDSARGQGIGQQMFQWAIARAREAGCRMVQLTSNQARTDAIRFYEGLGFEASHVGMKLYLD